MVHSMTGFGAASGEADGVEYAVEVRSVNHRYYKCVIKLPDGFAQAEHDIDKMLRSRLSRGSVTLNVRMKVPDEQAAGRVNTAVVGSYIDQLRLLETEGDPTLRIDLGMLLQLPGCCEPAPLAELLGRTKDGLMELIAQALEALVRMRRQEGQALCEELRGQCDLIAGQLDVVAERAPQVVQEYHERLAARVQELVAAGKVRIDEQDLAREVAIFAERSDVTEEVCRLRGHLDQFRAALDTQAPAGRRLDFIAQEMLREANTIASKANDGQIGRACVDIKTAIDRVKEQVQNIE